MNIYSVILAGGSGTRFWPASRRARPKQLLALGPSQQSLLRQTYERMKSLSKPEHMLIATGAHLLDATRQTLPELPQSSFLGEPYAKNTAPCIAWAVERIHRQDPQALVVVVPSDQYIQDATEFERILRLAIDSAATDVLTVLGIEPTRPETGYGYIESGAEVRPGVRQVKRFVEKPNRETAEAYLRQGGFYWNAGMFVFRASVFMKELQRSMPDLAQGVRDVGQAATRGADAETDAVEALFRSTASISIDYGVMEKAPKIQVVPADFGWNDLGSFQVAWELSSKDGSGNVLPSGAMAMDASDNFVLDGRSGPDGRIVALVGVSDLCVVQTDDALLIIPRQRCQEVKDIVVALQEAKRHTLL